MSSNKDILKRMNKGTGFPEKLSIKTPIEVYKAIDKILTDLKCKDKDLEKKLKELEDKIGTGLNFVQSVNGVLPDNNGNVILQIETDTIYTANGEIDEYRTIKLADSMSALEIIDQFDNILFSISESWIETIRIDYLADYSSQYTNRSLVDKEYVDNLTPSASDIRVMFSANSPLSYNNTTGVFSVATGYQIPQTSDFTNWNNKQNAITGAASTITTNNLTANRAVISDGAGKVAVSTVTNTELGYVSGVTSAIQTQLNSKQATITGGATTILSSNLAANFALISDANGKVAVSTISTTKLGYLTDVTSNIQAQINSKFTTPAGNVNQVVLGNGSLGNKHSILRKVTEVERLALTGLTDGDVVYQTNGGKGVYLYQNSTWYFVGEKLESKPLIGNLVLEDIGYFLLYDNVANLNVTVPSGVFKRGHTFEIYQMNTGTITILGAVGITIVYPPTFSNTSYEQYSLLRLKFLTDTIVLVEGLTI